MDDVRAAVGITILLVGADPISVDSIGGLALECDYGVVSAPLGADALRLLQQDLHGIRLVLLDLRLPDMCPFEFLEIVETETRLPVVMISDTYDEEMMSRGLMIGAMFILVKPLRLRDVREIWQHCLVKEREVWLESFGPLMRNAAEVEESTVTAVVETEPMLHDSAGTSQWHKKRKIEEMEKAEGTPNGELSSFVWFPKIVQEMGLQNAPPLEVFNQLNVPGLTIECVTEGLQQFHLCLELQPLSGMISPHHIHTSLNSHMQLCFSPIVRAESATSAALVPGQQPQGENEEMYKNRG